MYIRKIPYKLETRYGVLTGISRNKIVVTEQAVKGGPDEFQDAKSAREQALKLPIALNRPIYEVIADHEQLKQYCRDQKIDKELDLRKSMDNLRKDVKEYYEKADSRLDADNADGLLAKS